MRDGLLATNSRTWFFQWQKNGLYHQMETYTWSFAKMLSVYSEGEEYIDVTAEDFVWSLKYARQTTNLKQSGSGITVKEA